MRLFIELPSWLGDGVMASASIENLALNFTNLTPKEPLEIVFFGSFASIELYKTQPNCKQAILDESKKITPKLSFLKPIYRLIYLRKLAKKLGDFDLAISFRSHLASKVLINALNARKKAVFSPKIKAEHQVLKYLDFVNNALNLQPLSKDLKLHFKPLKKQSRARLGINAGASYGDAKRWGASNFAKVAKEMAKDYDIFIFGAKGEEQIADEIAKDLSAASINYTNLCAKTSIKELCEHIASLDLFITNDSGPMHIACAFKVPLIAIFGPTRVDETAPYGNERAKIIKLDLPCMPCMRRSCPLGHHDCMRLITPQMVLDKIKELKALC